MNPEDISQVVDEVVRRVVRRLADTTHGDLPTAADERLFGERGHRLGRAIELGAARLFPQALGSDQWGDLAPRIEMTLLAPDAREAEIRALCREAVERRYAAVCVGLEWVEVAAAELRGSRVALSTPVGFPTGGFSTESKAAEARRAVGQGAEEIDVVLNVGRLQAADYRAVVQDIAGVVQAAQGRRVKAVIEAAALGREQKVAAAVLAKAAGAAFVKSSTGFGPDGVTLGDIILIRAALVGQAPPPETGEWAGRVGGVVCLEVK